MHDWELVNAYSRYHPRWFESVDGYAPSSEYVEAFEALTPPDWTLRRTGLWYLAETPQVSVPEQGWKIHVAVRSQDSLACLERAMRCALDASVSFKFLLDTQTL
ncbi:class III lanthionine synthetase LanKC N-terminal domain-containing protein, partial [Streptomyces sp. NPDC005009]